MSLPGIPKDLYSKKIPKWTPIYWGPLPTSVAGKRATTFSKKGVKNPFRQNLLQMGLPPESAPIRLGSFPPQGLVLPDPSDLFERQFRGGFLRPTLVNLSGGASQVIGGDDDAGGDRPAAPAQPVNDEQRGRDLWDEFTQQRRLRRDRHRASRAIPPVGTTTPKPKPPPRPPRDRGEERPVFDTTTVLNTINPTIDPAQRIGQRPDRTQTLDNGAGRAPKPPGDRFRNDAALDEQTPPRPNPPEDPVRQRVRKDKAKGNNKIKINKRGPPDFSDALQIRGLETPVRPLDGGDDGSGPTTDRLAKKPKARAEPTILGRNDKGKERINPAVERAEGEREQQRRVAEEVRRAAEQADINEAIEQFRREEERQNRPADEGSAVGYPGNPNDEVESVLINNRPSRRGDAAQPAVSTPPQPPRDRARNQSIEDDVYEQAYAGTVPDEQVPYWDDQYRDIDASRVEDNDDGDDGIELSDVTSLEDEEEEFFSEASTVASEPEHRGGGGERTEDIELSEVTTLPSNQDSEVDYPSSIFEEIATAEGSSSRGGSLQVPKRYEHHPLVLGNNDIDYAPATNLYRAEGGEKEQQQQVVQYVTNATGSRTVRDARQEEQGRIEERGLPFEFQYASPTQRAPEVTAKQRREQHLQLLEAERLSVQAEREKAREEFNRRYEEGQRGAARQRAVADEHNPFRTIDSYIKDAEKGNLSKKELKEFKKQADKTLFHSEKFKQRVSEAIAHNRQKIREEKLKRQTLYENFSESFGEKEKQKEARIDKRLRDERSQQKKDSSDLQEQFVKSYDRAERRREAIRERREAEEEREEEERAPEVIHEQFVRSYDRAEKRREAIKKGRRQIEAEEGRKKETLREQFKKNAELNKRKEGRKSRQKEIAERREKETYASAYEKSQQARRQSQQERSDVIKRYDIKKEAKKRAADASIKASQSRIKQLEDIAAFHNGKLSTDLTIELEKHKQNVEKKEQEKKDLEFKNRVDKVYKKVSDLHAKTSAINKGRQWAAVPRQPAASINPQRYTDNPIDNGKIVTAKPKPAVKAHVVPKTAGRTTGASYVQARRERERQHVTTVGKPKPVPVLNRQGRPLSAGKTLTITEAKRFKDQKAADKQRLEILDQKRKHVKLVNQRRDFQRQFGPGLFDSREGGAAPFSPRGPPTVQAPHVVSITELTARKRDRERTQHRPAASQKQSGFRVQKRPEAARSKNPSSIAQFEVEAEPHLSVQAEREKKGGYIKERTDPVGQLQTIRREKHQSHILRGSPQAPTSTTKKRGFYVANRITGIGDLPKTLTPEGDLVEVSSARRPTKKRGVG